MDDLLQAIINTPVPFGIILGALIGWVIYR